MLKTTMLWGGNDDNTKTIYSPIIILIMMIYIYMKQNTILWYLVKLKRRNGALETIRTSDQYLRRIILTQIKC